MTWKGGYLDVPFPSAVDERGVAVHSMKEVLGADQAGRGWVLPRTRA